MPTIVLPRSDRSLEHFTTGGPKSFPEKPERPFNRIAFAAAHVVPDPMADANPLVNVQIDWDQTIAFRKHLWKLGLGVAEAMDTAQRGMGLDWPTSMELIKRSVEASKDIPDALIASGAGTDHLDLSKPYTPALVTEAYEKQCEAVESAGGRIILMASRALAACAESPDDFLMVYNNILRQVKEPVIIHWLGEMFDPALAGYWGHSDHWEAMNVCLEVLESNSNKVDGIKVSLLDKDKECKLRSKLPKAVRMYTGDDFNYPELIGGDKNGHSDALLGIFDAIAPAASAALTALSSNNLDEFYNILEPTVSLSRHIFKAPTQYYKTGIVFMAYLNGHQEHFIMVGGQQSARSALHLSEIFRLADKAGLLKNPDLAATRMRQVMALHGIGT
tara:strand:+ start:771 stop:1937 length:1167 start_codon:yes stop_codon:yes gene_type:complete